MKKVVIIIVALMVIALVLGSVMGYKTDSLSSALSGLEETVGYVTMVSDRALFMLREMGSFPAQMEEYFADKFGETDYSMPIYYKRLCGDTAYDYDGTQIWSVLMGCEYPSAACKYVKIGDAIYASRGKDFTQTLTTRNYIFTELTAKALYYHDLWTVVQYYDFYIDTSMPRAVKDAMFEAHCRIEGKNEGIFNKQIWRWNVAQRKEYAERYRSILEDAEDDLKVWYDDYVNIGFYEFQVFLLYSEETGYTESSPNLNFFNVKNYGKEEET